MQLGGTHVSFIAMYSYTLAISSNSFLVTIMCLTSCSKRVLNPGIMTVPPVSTMFYTASFLFSMFNYIVSLFEFWSPYFFDCLQNWKGNVWFLIIWIAKTVFHRSVSCVERQIEFVEIFVLTAQCVFFLPHFLNAFFTPHILLLLIFLHHKQCSNFDIFKDLFSEIKYGQSLRI